MRSGRKDEGHSKGLATGRMSSRGHKVIRSGNEMCVNEIEISSSNASRLVDEPYAGKPHVRFCEGVAPRNCRGGSTRRPNIALGLTFAFLVNTFGPLPIAQADEFRLPVPGVRVGLSPEYNPPILKGLKVHPDNPFRFDFILDQENSLPLVGRAREGEIKQQATRLIKYFLASLTIPEKDLWVNLSPYEKNRIVPESFGQTEMGRDLLAEDYMLKQITASLIYPEDDIGKKFWKRIYEEAAKKFGTTNIPVNTFNKVWIIPEKAVVFENAKAGTAYVVEAKLKVMLEQDYLALSKSVSLRGASETSDEAISKRTTNNDVNALGSQIVREIVIPELTKEVNEDKNFSQLRQVYNSLILATWYKKKIKESILSQVYADKNKIVGVQYTSTVIPRSPPVIPAKAGIQNNNDIEAIYQRYLQAFKKGVYNYIKEEIDPLTQQSIPRKYFSGGTFLGNLDLKTSSSIDFAQTTEGLTKVEALVDGLNQRAYQDPVFIVGPGSNDRRSYLDRHYLQGQILHNSILPYLIKRNLGRRTNGRQPRLVISDLGASTGEELARLFYEIVVALETNGQNPNNWDIKIEGFDIDPQKVIGGWERILNHVPFFRAIRNRGQTSVDGRYYADLIMEKLNQYPEKFKKSVGLDEENILEIPPDYLSGTDLIVLNHILGDMDNHQAVLLLQQLSRKSPQAIMAVGDLDRMLSNFEYPDRNHVFINSQMVSGKTAYYFGLPREAVGKVHFGDEAMAIGQRHAENRDSAQLAKQPVDQAMRVGKLTFMGTEAFRLRQSTIFIPLMLQALFKGAKQYVLDIGFGFTGEDGPITTKELAKEIPNAQVIAIDNQMPEYQLVTPRGQVLLDQDGHILSLETAEEFKPGDDIPLYYKIYFQELFEQMRYKVGPDNLIFEDGKNKIIYQPMEQHRPNNIQYLSGDLFNLQAIKDQLKGHKADVVRIANVIDPYYGWASINDALMELNQFMNEDGIVLIGSRENKNKIEQYFVYRKLGNVFKLVQFAAGELLLPFSFTEETARLSDLEYSKEYLDRHVGLRDLNDAKIQMIGNNLQQEGIPNTKIGKTLFVDMDKLEESASPAAIDMKQVFDQLYFSQGVPREVPVDAAMSDMAMLHDPSKSVWKEKDLWRFRGSKIDLDYLLRGGPIRRLKHMYVIRRDISDFDRYYELQDNGYKQDFVRSDETWEVNKLIDKLTENGRSQFPFIYKPNNSSWSMEVFFLETDLSGQHLIITALYRPTEIFKNPSRIIESVLRPYDNIQIKTDTSQQLIQFTLNRKDPKIKEILRALFKAERVQISVDSETLFYDPGFLETAMDFIKPENRAFESRHRVVLDAQTGDIDIGKSDFFNESRWGTSSYFTTYGTEETGENVFEPFYKDRIVARNDRQQFESNVINLVSQQTKYVWQRLRGLGINVQGTELQVQLDLMWLKNEKGGFPIPVITEGLVKSKLKIDNAMHSNKKGVIDLTPANMNSRKNGGSGQLTKQLEDQAMNNIVKRLAFPEGNDLISDSGPKLLRATVLKFEGVGGKDVYNIVIFRAKIHPGDERETTIIAGRVEDRGSEFSEVMFFKRSKGKWHPIKDAPIFKNSQDPSVKKIGDKFVVSVVKVGDNGKKLDNGKPRLFYYTEFHQFKTLEDLGSAKRIAPRIARGPSWMKDIRLVKLKDGRILIMTRPQGDNYGGHYGQGKIAYRIVKNFREFVKLAQGGIKRSKLRRRMEKGTVLEGMFRDDLWSGTNALHLLENGKVGVLGHIARFNKKGKREYAPITFEFDPKTRKVSSLQAIGPWDTLAQLLHQEIPIKPLGTDKTSDTEKVWIGSGLVFSKGRYSKGRHFKDRYVLSGGARDTSAPVGEITPPFTSPIADVNAPWSILKELFVRKDEAQLVKSKIGDRGQWAQADRAMRTISQIDIEILDLIDTSQINIVHNGQNLPLNVHMYPLSGTIFEKLLEDVKKNLGSSGEKIVQELTQKYQIEGTSWQSVDFSIVLRELIGNAKRFTWGKEDGKIEVMVNIDHNNLIISVSDNGIGLKANIKGRIFDKWFTTKIRRDSGVGLTYSKRFIEQVWKGAKIEAFDNTEDLHLSQEGATFRITIPIDRAMQGSKQYADEKGGIDLTSDKALSVQNSGEGIKFHIDSAMLEQLRNAPGFVPVIISVEPMNDLRQFLTQ